MDFTKFFTSVANRRKTSLIRKLAKTYMMNKKCITLANGMPNSSTFPFEEISVRYKGGMNMKLTGQDLAMALQYGPTEGYMPLVSISRELQSHLHKPKYDNWDVSFTSGSQDGCSKILEMLVEPGDAVLFQIPAFAGSINAVGPLLPEFIGIEQDADGIIPQQIEKVCAERVRTRKAMPKLLYVNPTGANPTGTCLTESRRREVYKLAQKYNFLIIEDDPYYFINFLPRTPPSFFELDTDGRVIRLDSFSKVLSAGIRLGVVTAHKSIIHKLTLHMETTVIHASSLSQMLLHQLLKSWGIEKFKEHCQEVRQFYEKRRDIMLQSIEKHLTGLAEWHVPNGGMFFWIKVTALEDVMELTTKKCLPEGVLVLPGHAFNYDMTKPDRYIRCSYSYASPEEIDKAFEIIAKLIREEASKKRID